MLPANPVQVQVLQTHHHHHPLQVHACKCCLATAYSSTEPGMIRAWVMGRHTMYYCKYYFPLGTMGIWVWEGGAIEKDWELFVSETVRNSWNKFYWKICHRTSAGDGAF